MAFDFIETQIFENIGESLRSISSTLIRIEKKLDKNVVEMGEVLEGEKTEED